jgi:hypothetical protein
MSKTIGQPGQDLPEPILPDDGDNDAIGRPDDGGAGIGNDTPTRPVEPNPMHEPDPTTPNPAIPDIRGPM